MKLLFAAAVVLLYTQVLFASPDTSVNYSSKGSRTVTTQSQTITTGGQSGRTTTTTVVKSSGKNGNGDDDEGDCKACKAESGSVKVTEIKSSSKSGRDDDNDNKNGKAKTSGTRVTETTIEKTSSRKTRDGKGGDDDKGCSHGRDRSRELDDKKNGKSSKASGKKGGGKNGDKSKNRSREDDDDNSKRRSKEDHDYSKKKIQYDWQYGQSDEKNDNNNVKVTKGQSGHQTTTTTIVTSSSSNSVNTADKEDNNGKGSSHGKGGSKIKDDDDTSKRTREWHYGNSADTGVRKDDDDGKKSIRYEWHYGSSNTGDGKDDGNDDKKRTQVEWHVEQGSNCEVIVKQLQAAYAEIALLRQHNALLTSDYRGLQTRVTTITSESQSWESKYEACSITLRQVQEINIKLELDLKVTKTTIITLQNNIEEMKSTTINNDKELSEWKHKYQILSTDSDSYRKQIKELTNSNTDSKKTVKELTGKITSCQKDGHQLSVEIINLKSIAEGSKKNVSTCELEKKKLNDALNLKIKQYDEDELRDHEKLMLHKRVEADLTHCRGQLTEVDKNYKSETSNVIKCRNENVVIREDCAKSGRKYENDIKVLQTSVDQFKASLKIEIDLKNTCVIENKNYVLNINEVQYQLDLSRKATIEAQSQTKRCEDNANSLNKSIDEYKRTITETNTQLTECGTRSASIQIDLTTCQSSKEKCGHSLEEIKEILKKSETRILQLESENGSLATGKQKCEGELSSLRCDTNKYLASIESTEDAAYKKLASAEADYIKTKAAIKKFVASKNITCNQS